MAKLANVQQRELERLLSAARCGLPARLGNFLTLAVASLRSRVELYPNLHSREQLDEYIKTLTYLIDLGVHDR